MSSNLLVFRGKRLNALDLRISGLQGASGEQKRDINKLRDETNNLTVKSAAHDVDIGKNTDDIKKIERQRAEDNQRHKQDMDAVYEELDQKVYEKNFLGLEDNEAIKFVQDGMLNSTGGEHLVVLDPKVPTGTSTTLISEAAIRAMYKHWRQEMGL